MKRPAIVLLALLAAGCHTPDDGFGVQMTVTADASVDGDALARIVRLEFAVSGSETAAPRVDLARPMQRTERVVYRPQAKTRGRLTFALGARDGEGTLVAEGMAFADLVAGRVVLVDLPLSAVATPAPVDDAGIPPDAAAMLPDLADACVRTAADTDLYVDQSSTATTANGTLGCPYRTITDAIDAAHGHALTIHVAGGTYDDTTEAFPLQLRNGISLVGAGVDKTIILGSKAFETWWKTWQTTIVIGEKNGTSRLSNLTIRPNGPRPRADGYAGLVCDRGAPGQVSAKLDNVMVGTGYEVGILMTNDSGSCNLEMTASQVRGNWQGIWIYADSGNPCAEFAQLKVGDDTSSGHNEFSENTRVAVVVWDCATAQLLGNTFDNNNGGFYVEQGPPPAGTPGHTVRGNVFSNNSEYGVALHKNGTLELLAGNNFTHNSSRDAAVPAAGLLAQQTSQVRKARGNRFIGNDYGVWFEGTSFSDHRDVANDFGTSGDDGQNVFSCNSLAAHSGGGGGNDFAVTAEAGNFRTGTISLFGNQWDAPPPIAIAGGGAAAGANLYVTTTSLGISGHNSGTQVATPIVCPDGRSP